MLYESNIKNDVTTNDVFISFIAVHNKCIYCVCQADKTVSYKGLLLHFESGTVLFTFCDKH